MSNRAKGVRAKVGWAIAMLEESKERLKKYRANEDHCKSLKLKGLQVRIDMVLAIAKELQSKYPTRKQEDQ